jgi:hypothetical protein
MINQTESKAEPVTPAIPADMPKDKAGNIAYEGGNYFRSAAHPDGLPRPHHAHEPTSWASMLVDPDILSQPAPNSRYGLIVRLHSGPYHELGYQGHCHACHAYFVEYPWAQDHECREEAAFRDVTRREIRDYPALRRAQKTQKLLVADQQATQQKRGILATLKRLVPFARG